MVIAKCEAKKSFRSEAKKRLQPIPDSDAFENVKQLISLVTDTLTTGSKKTYLKRKKDIYFYVKSKLMCYKNGEEGQVKNLEKRCVLLANSCLDSHRFEDAAKLLWVVCHNRDLSDIFLLKACILTLENLNNPDEPETIFNFLNNLQNLRVKANKKEIQLEYLIYGLKNNVPELHNKLEDLLSVKRKQIVRKLQNFDPILSGYHALIDYISWGKFNEFQPSQARATGIKAVVLLRDLITKPGPFDIFVLKLVEMLEACGRSDEIEEVLLKYIEQNPDNINAYIYYVSFMETENPESLTLIKNLKILAELCPSDCRVLLLLEKLNKSGKKLNKCINYIFMFLDYPTNGSNIQAWEMLYAYHVQAIMNCDEKAIIAIKTCWKLRFQSWQWMYFQPVLSPSDCLGNDSALVALKIDTLSFVDAGNGYKSKMLKLIPEVGELLKIPEELEDSLDLDL